jgi:site-specific recombinase XerD
MEHLEDFKKLLTVKRYSYNTITSYSYVLKKFFTYFNDKTPEDIQPSQIEQYINHLVADIHISPSYQKMLVGAIKLFYNDLLRKNYHLNYLYPDRSEKKLPIVLEKSEVRHLLNSTQN